MNSWNPEHSQAWQNLLHHFNEISPLHMRDLFAQDNKRFDNFSLKFNDILLDYSKNRINSSTMDLLLQLAEEAGVKEWTEKLFRGESINHTEQRAALHVALRNMGKDDFHVNGESIMPAITLERERVRKLSDAIRARTWRGYTGQAITDVVNIGIGGSDLGPVMVTEALRPYALRDIKLHFVSNLDENHIHDTLEQVRPETTLFIISSKSFTTLDTKINASTAMDWFIRLSGGWQYSRQHFVAVTANAAEARRFGISENNVFNIWDWVGGRYSLWSAVGLPIAISVGMDKFEELLLGAYDMDQHFRTQPLDKNMPVIMALLGIWYNNFFNAQAHAVLPYDQHLHRLPAYLQQADMESNGKSVNRNGETTNYSTGPIVFGEIGINAQHAFYQLLHQGTKLIPADILAPVVDLKTNDRHHNALMANVFAQSESLMRGKTEQEAREEMHQQGLDDDSIESLLPYKVFSGNRPTNTLIFDTLDARTLGALIALYEHKIFVQGVIWNINSFDQWGVELGKQMATTILDEIDEHQLKVQHDASTNGLIEHYLRTKQELAGEIHPGNRKAS